MDTVKFLCSYGGKILPRHPDGKLRYIGGETRVLAFKLGELYGSAVSLRCQLPQYDLDALVSITSDEDLANVIEEYDLASQASGSQLKIRVFLSPLKAAKKISVSPTSFAPSSDLPTRKHLYKSRMASIRPIPSPIPFGIYANSGRVRKTKLCYYTGFPHLRQSRLVHTGNHWE
ncbi:hypothetical protein ACHQM5_011075 [Ranunculus cassubicifolius]